MFENEFNQVNINNKFIEAVMKPDLEKVKEMFEAEHQPYINSEINGVPVILYAAQKGDWAMVEELYCLEADLDANVPHLKWYLLHECIKNAPDRVTKSVLQYCNINAQTKSGKTALMVASDENKLPMAEYLVDSGRMDLSITDIEHNNAAHYAAKNSQYDLFIKIAQAGAPLNKENKKGETPMDLLADPTFKENLPKVLGELAKIEKSKNNTEEVSETEEAKVEDKPAEPVKPKVSGLSSIKKK